MKRYVFLLFFILAWATLSPFVAFRLLCGSFVPQNESSVVEAEHDLTEETALNNVFSESETQNVVENPTESEEASSEAPNETELLTAYLISKTDFEKYSPECQKALAVALRTQIIYGEENPQGEISEYLNKTALGGEDDLYNVSIPKCVLETEGIFLTHKGKTVNAIYHNSSYKTTVSSQNGEKYLTSVNTPEASADIKKEFVFSKDDVKKIISTLCPTAAFGDGAVIESIKYDDENRCKYIKTGNCAISASALAEQLQLPSLAFSVEESQNLVIFTVYGDGNGLGMSLKGAELLANEGKTYEEILKHYYSEIEISN